MRRPKRDPVREDRIYNEAIVDARPEEQAMSWYYYLEGKISFPFGQGVSPRTPSRHSGRGKPSKSYAWLSKMPASMTCLCKSVGKNERWPFLFPNWPPSIQTNRPMKPSATGITGSPRVTASNLRTAAGSSRPKGFAFNRDERTNAGCAPFPRHETRQIGAGNPTNT